MKDYIILLNSLIKRGKRILSLKEEGDSNDANSWMDEVQLFIDCYLKTNPLFPRMNSLLFHRRPGDFSKLLTCLTTIKRDVKDGKT